MTEAKERMIDISAPKGVSIEIRNDRKTVWVNVDGICALRISRIPVGALEILDESAAP